MADALMTRDEVAVALGIAPESVRSTLRRYGITEQRGYPRDLVENLRRPGRGARTDLTAKPDPTDRHSGAGMSTETRYGRALYVYADSSDAAPWADGPMVAVSNSSDVYYLTTAEARAFAADLLASAIAEESRATDTQEQT